MQRVGPVVWEIPSTFRPDMRVPVRVLADERLLDAALGDEFTDPGGECLRRSPAWSSHVTVMPDVHQGYGFPIGGVAATRLSDGVVSPGAIGYDINCGVRLLASAIRLDDVRPLPGRPGRRRSTPTARPASGPRAACR